MKICTSSIVGLAVLSIALLGTASSGATQTSSSQLAQDDSEAATGPIYREMIYGDLAAPVTIVEYASLTCSFCAQFHTDVLPDLKRIYIDTGKVRLVFRDFPLDELAMAGAMLTRCASSNRGQAMLNLMFLQQATWIRSERPIEPLTLYAKLAGMTEEDVNACLENENIMTAIREVQETARNLHKIESTPTFFIEDVKVEGNRGYEFMADIIEKKLKE